MAEAYCSLPSPGEDFADLSAGPLERLTILQKYRRVAMVGLSANPLRPSHFVAIYLANRGYKIIPVNPKEREILGRRCYPSLQAIDGPVEVVDVFRAPDAVPGIVEDAIAIEAKVVWMQFGVIHKGAARRALDAGLEVVIDKCMKVEHARFDGGLTAMGLHSGVVSSGSWGKPDGSPGL